MCGLADNCGDCTHHRRDDTEFLDELNDSKKHLERIRELFPLAEYGIDNEEDRQIIIYTNYYRCIDCGDLVFFNDETGAWTHVYPARPTCWAVHGEHRLVDDAPSTNPRNE